MALGGRGEDWGEISGEDGADLRFSIMNINKCVHVKTLMQEEDANSQGEILCLLPHDADSTLFGQDGGVLVTDALVEQHIGVPVAPPHIRIGVRYSMCDNDTGDHLNDVPD